MIIFELKFIFYLPLVTKSSLSHTIAILDMVSVVAATILVPATDLIGCIQTTGLVCVYTVIAYFITHCLATYQ